MCQLDCHALVQQLQAIRRGNTDWLSRRRRVLQRMAPAMASDRRCTTLCEKLVQQATEGHAWHADHIKAVYEGGGACGMDNIRTLCVRCHAEVTRRQSKARAAQKRRRAMHTHDIRALFGSQGAVVGSGGAGGCGAAVVPVQAAKRPRAAAKKRQYLDASPEQQPQPGRKKRGAKAASAAVAGPGPGTAAGAVGVQHGVRDLNMAADASKQASVICISSSDGATGDKGQNPTDHKVGSTADSAPGGSIRLDGAGGTPSRGAGAALRLKLLSSLASSPLHLQNSQPSPSNALFGSSGGAGGAAAMAAPLDQFLFRGSSQEADGLSQSAAARAQADRQASNAAGKGLSGISEQASDAEKTLKGKATAAANKAKHTQPAQHKALRRKLPAELEDEEFLPHVSRPKCTSKRKAQQP